MANGWLLDITQAACAHCVKLDALSCLQCGASSLPVHLLLTVVEDR